MSSTLPCPGWENVVGDNRCVSSAASVGNVSTHAGSHPHRSAMTHNTQAFLQPAADTDRTS